jgi:acetyltransferase-like isoleucine patch superfamily enzyme
VSLTSKLNTLKTKPFHYILTRLHEKMHRLIGVLYYRHIFASFGSGTVLYKPLLLSNPHCIHIGKDVVIRAGARLEALITDSAKLPEMRIGDNVNIEQNFHIGFAGKVIIHENVTIASHCSFLGATHPFMDVHNPIKIGARLGGAGSVIEIGAGSIIGVNCVIKANVRIGKHVVVGSNSVVNRNVPDYTVVEGNPAVVVMKYEKDQDRWIVPSRDASQK